MRTFLELTKYNFSIGEKACQLGEGLPQFLYFHLTIIILLTFNFLLFIATVCVLYLGPWRLCGVRWLSIPKSSQHLFSGIKITSLLCDLPTDLWNICGVSISYGGQLDFGGIKIHTNFIVKFKTDFSECFILCEMARSRKLGSSHLTLVGDC